MNNCKKCGSGDIRQRTIDQEKHQIVCMNCENETSIYKQPYMAKIAWNNMNKLVKPEYKTIPELREIFLKNADVNDSWATTMSYWFGYLKCAQDSGLLPADLDLSKERVK